jgi:hypothetical protein
MELRKFAQGNTGVQENVAKQVSLKTQLEGMIGKADDEQGEDVNLTPVK